MPVNSLLWVLSSCGLAALGQVFLKSGAAGALAPADYLNGRLLLGLLLYGLSTVCWIVALSRSPLSKVYPFTILTFLLVYVLSAVWLGERLGLQTALGAGLVLTGLLVITTS
ncbi:MAG TPA: EamA family transporter [Steroidobacteraceae bacterium]|nr:EamA family transporter [Steroidobacteraceae bacterium]